MVVRFLSLEKWLFLDLNVWDWIVHFLYEMAIIILFLTAWKGISFPFDLRGKPVLGLIDSLDGLNVNAELANLLAFLYFFLLPFLHFADVLIHGIGHNGVVLAWTYFSLLRILLELGFADSLKLYKNFGSLPGRLTILDWSMDDIISDLFSTNELIIIRFLDVEAAAANAVFHFVLVVGGIIFFVFHFQDRLLSQWFMVPIEHAMH